MANVDFQVSKFHKKVFHFISWIFKRTKFYKTKYITEKVRDIYPSRNQNYLPDNTSDVAILMQGPIIEKNQFTLETIKLYQRNFPKAKIILSTWESERKKIKNFERADFKILFEVPKYQNIGYKSTNLQILSTQNGLNYLKHKEYNYILKTRTDQRYSNPEMLVFLKSLLKNFPINNPRVLKQEQRLIGLSFNTFLYRLYGLSDMFLFGTTNDVFNFWNCPFDMRDFTTIPDFSTKRKYSLLRICEVYFMTEYLKSRGEEINWTLRQSWDELAKRFLIVDSSSLDFFWPKYSYLEDRWKQDNTKIIDKEISFSTWLRILSNEINCDENLLDY